MCDCFHLPFPNWQAPGTGAGRRLRGPEDTEDDSQVYEEPLEVLEGERPRPQGSSPVEEFPATEKYDKQSPEDLYDPLNKTGSAKKGKRIGFGSLFDKRSSAKMSQTEDFQNEESEVIVKTVKEACAEGLVVSGGGKEGIFIKEVKPESPASKHLGVKEGDQILSATVYFDNVTYEDALQILEHAQPYKMEFCLKRKPAEPPSTENADTTKLDDTIDEEGGTPKMRGREKTKRQQDARISWPKFPSLRKGHKTHFKRSHSTSEAEDQRKLEMSPPTSDTESPLKTSDGKEKRKKHKMKLKMKVKGLRSKSVEQPLRDDMEPTENIENEGSDTQQILDVIDAQSPEEHEQVINEMENYDATKIKNECTIPVQQSSEIQHKVELISLDKTLKTTDISAVFIEDSSTEKRTETSELKVHIQGRDITGIDAMTLTSNSEITGEQLQQKTMGPGKMDVDTPNVDTLFDMPDAGIMRKSPRVESHEKPWKEPESYGIRTRGPLADIASSKVHFANNINGLQFTISENSGLRSEDDLKPIIPKAVVSQPKPNVLDSREILSTNLDSKNFTVSSETDTDVFAQPGTQTEGNFKLPHVDLSGYVPQQPIIMTEQDRIKAQLPKREDIEIPGMEDKTSKVKLTTPAIKLSKLENIPEDVNIVAQKKGEEFSVEDVKAAVSILPAFRLPDRDITGVLVHREITMMGKNVEKLNVTPKGSPCKISPTNVESGIILSENYMEDSKMLASRASCQEMPMKVPKADLRHFEDHEHIAATQLDISKPKLQTFPKESKTDDKQYKKLEYKLPKREDIEIPGMEAIEKSKAPTTKPEQDAPTLTLSSDIKRGKTAAPAIDIDMRGDDLIIETSPSDRKRSEKKSKKTKITMPSIDIRFPDIGIEFPKKDSSPKKQTAKVKDAKDEVMSPPDDTSPAAVSFLSGFVNLKGSKTESTISKPEKSQKEKSSELEFEITAPDTPIINIPIKQEEKEDIQVQDVSLPGQDISPHKKKSSKFKMPKLGGKSAKGTKQNSEIKTEVTHSEFDVKEEKIDGTQDCSDTKEWPLETDKSKSKTKIPSIDVSIPTVKIPKMEFKSKQEDITLKFETVDDSGEESGFRPIDFGISKVKEQETETDPSMREMVSLIKYEKKEPGFEIEAQKLSSNEAKGPDMSMEAETETKGSKFKLPKLGISLPKVKGPEADGSFPKIQAEIISPSGKEDVLSEDLPEPLTEGELIVPVTEPKDSEIKIKKRKISFPKFGKSKSDSKASADFAVPKTDDCMTEISTQMYEPEVDSKAHEIEVEIKETSTDSPTKFKMPSIKFPKFGVTTPKFSSEATTIETEIDVGTDVTTSDVRMLPEVPSDQMEALSVGVDMKTKESELEGQGTKLKLPNLKISLHGEKEGEGAMSVPKGGICVPDENVQGLKIESKIEIVEEEAEGMDKSISVSTAEFKLPTFSMPKFGSSSTKSEGEKRNFDSEIKGLQIESGTLTDVPALHMQSSKDSAEQGTDGEAQSMEVTVAAKGYDSDGQGVKFKLPKFGISFPKMKERPETTIDDHSLPESNLEMTAPTLEAKGQSAEKTSDISDVDSKEVDVKMKKQKISFPKFGFSKLEAKAPEVDFSAADVDAALPEGKLEFRGPEIDIKKEDTSGNIEKPSLHVNLPELSGLSLSGEGHMLEKEKTSVTFGGDLTDLGMQEGKIGVETPNNESLSVGLDVKISKPSIQFPKIGFSSKGSGDQTHEQCVPEVPSIEIKSSDVDAEAPSVEMQSKDIELMGQESKFKLPKFGISLPKVKVQGLDVSGSKPDVDISVEKGEVCDVNVPVPSVEAGLEITDLDAEGIDPVMPESGFSKPASEKLVVTIPKVDISLSGRNVDMAQPEKHLDATEGDGSKDVSTVTSPTKFKLPTIKFPKFGISAPKEHTMMEADIKGPQGIQLDTELRGGEIPSAEIKGSKADVEALSVDVDIKAKGGDVEVQGSKIKMPKFGIALPKVKASDVDLDVGQAEEKEEVQALDAKDPNVTTDGKGGTPNMDLDVKIKKPSFAFPKFSLSKSTVKGTEGDPSLSKVDIPIPEVDVTLQSANMESKDGADTETGQKDPSTSDSPSKFKLPTMNFPKFGGKGPKVVIDKPVVDVNIKGPEVSLSKSEVNIPKVPTVDIKAKGTDATIKGPEVRMSGTEVELAGKIHPVEIKEPGTEIVVPAAGVDLKVKGTELEGQGSKFKLPKFGIALPKVKGPEMDVSVSKPEVDVSLPEGKVEILPQAGEIECTTAEINAELPKVESRGLKKPSFTFPRFGFSKEAKVKEVTGVPQIEAVAPEVSADVQNQEIKIEAPDVKSEVKDPTVDGSSIKIKLPTLKLPRFGVTATGEVADSSGADATITDSTIGLPGVDGKVAIEIPSTETRQLEIDIDAAADVDKDKDAKLAGKFKLPKFGIALPQVKGPGVDIDASNQEGDSLKTQGKIEVQPPDAKLEDITIGKGGTQEMESEEVVVKVKRPSFTFPKFGFSKQEVKAKEVVVHPQLDVSVPEGSIEAKELELEGKAPEVKVKETKGGSPTKFKLPTLKMPKFGAPAMREITESSAEISITEPSEIRPGDIKLSTGVQSVEIQAPTMSIEGDSVDMKSTEVELEGSKFKLPEFGITVKKVKSPEIDMEISKQTVDVSAPLAKIKIQPPETTTEAATIGGNVDLPEVDSKDLDVKTKRSSFTFPRFGFSKPDVKTTEVDVSKADISVSEGSSDVKLPEVNIKNLEGEAELSDKPTVVSPSKFKLPTITFPKFGVTTMRESVEIPEGEVSITGPEISISGSTVEVKGEIQGKTITPGVDTINVERSSKGAEDEESENKFKLPKFGISLPKVKGPEMEVSQSKPDVEVSLPEGTVEIQHPIIDVENISTAVKVETPEVESKGSDIKIKTSGFSFPKFGFFKSDSKAEVDSSVPKVEVKDVDVEKKAPESDIQVKHSTVISPSKMKLPTIKFPKFGATAPKVTVEAPHVDVDIKEHDVKEHDATLKISIEHPSGAKDLDLKAEGLEIHAPQAEVNLPKIDISIQEGNEDTKEQEIDPQALESELKAEVTMGAPSRFKLPTFKMPKLGITPPKTTIKISEQDVKAEMMVSEDNSAEIKTLSPIVTQPSKISDIKAIVNEDVESIPQTTEARVAPLETDVRKDTGDDKGSPSKFKLPSFKVPKIGLSKAKSVDGDMETDVGGKNTEPVEGKAQKENTKGLEKSPKFTLPTLDDVIRGFEVEFNVPKIEDSDGKKEESATVKQEIEAEAEVKAAEVTAVQKESIQEKSKFKFRFPKLGFNQSSEGSDKVPRPEEEQSEQPVEPEKDQKVEEEKDEQSKSDKSGWFTFPKFSSPTKTTDVTETKTNKPIEEAAKSPVSENIEEDMSLTLSMRSSDAFADVSSAVTTEQVGLSLSSPTKVTVKYAEPTPSAEIQTELITSTARTELISMEPYQPEKVNIPFSSDMSSSSVDTLKQMSGEVHIITSNLQASPDTQKATIITNIDGQEIQTLSTESGSVKTIFTTQSLDTTSGVHSEELMIMEKHVVKEVVGDGKGVVVVTQRTRVFEGDSAEPISDETASSIRKLKDTVHTEKLRFFESVETVKKTSVTSTEEALRHVDSSTDENEGK